MDQQEGMNGYFGQYDDLVAAQYQNPFSYVSGPGFSQPLNAAEALSADVAGVGSSSSSAVPGPSTSEPRKKRKRVEKIGPKVDNTTSDKLVTASSIYAPAPFLPGHRFYGILRNAINADDKAQRDLANKNRLLVKKMFIDDFQRWVLADEMASTVAKDSAILSASIWKYFGVDMMEKNPVSELLFPYPNPPKFENAKLKALNQVLNAHKHQEDKFQGIIDRMRARFNELNVNNGGSTTYLSSGEIKRLFGIKSKKEMKTSVAAQQAAKVAFASTLPTGRMVSVPEELLREWSEDYRKLGETASRRAAEIDNFLASYQIQEQQQQEQAQQEQEEEAEADEDGEFEYLEDDLSGDGMMGQGDHDMH